MLQNYQYFLTLAETLNISQAAKQLFISHQCLSRYLKTLESECGLMLFERKPSLSLTYAGETLLAAFRQIQRIEQDTLSQLEEIQDGTSGEVRIGITEGRLRIFFPRLLESYQPLFPNVTLRVTSAPTAQMLDRLLENKLDLVLGSPTGQFNPALDYSAVLNETLEPIRERRKQYEGRIEEVYEILRKGSEHARATAAQTLGEVRHAMRIDYFDDKELIAEQARQYQQQR